MAGIAGGIYAYYYQYISPDQFEILQSAMLLTMVVVGGMGSHLGPVVGAVLLLLMPQAISFLNLAIFNLPACSDVAASLQVTDFYSGDLSIYRNFKHPQGWGF